LRCFGSELAFRSLEATVDRLVEMSSLGMSLQRAVRSMNNQMHFRLTFLRKHVLRAVKIRVMADKITSSGTSLGVLLEVVRVLLSRCLVKS
jgi:hypothetical protein